MNRGVFVAIEGVYNIGKTTQCELAIRHFNGAIHLQSPDRKTKTGKILDAFLRNEITLRSDVAHLLFSANRKEQQDFIKSSILSNKIVIADRYHYSGASYGAVSGLSLKWCLGVDAGNIEPDIVIYLKATTEYIKSINRDNEKFDAVSMQLALAKEFSNLIGKNWVIIDVELPVEIISEMIVACISEISNKCKKMPIKYL